MIQMIQLSKADKNSLLKDFIELVKINSPSKDEGKMCEHIIKKLRKLTMDIYRIDLDGKDASKYSGPSNILAHLRINQQTDKKLILCAHLDTVRSTGGFDPEVTNGVVRIPPNAPNRENLVLGADNKAGVALILFTVRKLLQLGIPCPELLLIFTVQEELGWIGMQGVVKSQKFQEYRADGFTNGIVVDGIDRPENIARQFPSLLEFRAEFKGIAAHAGGAPQLGSNAALALARTVVDFGQWGRIDDDTTSNFVIPECTGSLSTIPDRAVLEGQIRGFDTSVVQEYYSKFCKTAYKYPPVEVKTTRFKKGYLVPDDSPVIKAAKAVEEATGKKNHLIKEGGTSDGNALAEAGVMCPVFPTGASEIHTSEEKLILDAFYAAAELLVNTVIAYSQ